MKTMKTLRAAGRPSRTAWSKLTKDVNLFDRYNFASVSVVVPTYNQGNSVARTLDSLMAQDYPELDIIVVDAGSTDKTLQIVRSYDPLIVRLHSVYEYDLYEMLNKGIALARGRYVNFLYPGGFYIQKDSLKYMMALACDHEMPHMIFGGTLLRSHSGEVRVLFRALTESSMRQGKQPTSLEACWFRRDLFGLLGNFTTWYGLRGGFDLLCRLVKHPDLDVVSTSRVVTDYEVRVVTRQMILHHFWETLKVLLHHFGIIATMRWASHQQDTRRYLRSWFRSIKVAILGNP